MKEKKTRKAMLEDKRAIFMELGLIIALSVTLFAFEQKKYDAIKAPEQEQVAITGEEEEIILNTEREQLPEPPPPTPTTVIDIVDNDVDVDEDFEIDAEADASMEMEGFKITGGEEKEDDLEEEIFMIVEQQAEFPGGLTKLYDFLRENIKYPDMAKSMKITGTVYVQFVVSSSGKISRAKALNELDGGLTEEALRVVKLMPKWAPGKQRGNPVSSYFTIPIKFTLAGS